MIESAQNPKIRLARALRRPQRRRREGLLVAEGRRLIADALAAGTTPELILATPAALDEPQIAALVAPYAGRTWPVAPALMAEISETVTPQGIVALLPLPRLDWPETPTLLLVVDRLRDPGNLGTLLRAAAAAGAEGVLLATGTVDPWGDKVLRSGVGAHFRLPIREGLVWDQIAPLVDGLALRLAESDGEHAYDAVDWTRPSALLVGGEARGAGPQARAHVTERVSIPMARGVESLNAAMAGGIILFEAARQRRARS